MRFSDLRRREFITLVGSAAASWPLAARAQPPGKIPRLGVLLYSNPQADPQIESFRRGLRDLGYIDGQNLAIEYRYAEGRPEKLPELAAELAHLKPNVMLAIGGDVAPFAVKATQTIPIVFAISADPVQLGLVASLARPGGNITGHSATVAEMAAKRVEILKTVVRDLSRLAFLANAATVRQAVTGTEAAGRTLGVKVTTLLVRNATELDQIFSNLKKEPVGGLIVDLTLQDHSREIIDFVVASRGR